MIHKEQCAATSGYTSSFITWPPQKHNDKREELNIERYMDATLRELFGMIWMHYVFGRQVQGVPGGWNSSSSSYVSYVTDRGFSAFRFWFHVFFCGRIALGFSCPFGFWLYGDWVRFQRLDERILTLTHAHDHQHSNKYVQYWHVLYYSSPSCFFIQAKGSSGSSN